jgi:NTP pyrophosphatase (non-canonical NTP hydrolase)
LINTKIKHQQQLSTLQQQLSCTQHLGLAGEAGEVANKVKKIIRDNAFDRGGIAAELGDCLWYIAALARDLNISLSDIAKENLDKLDKRKKDGKIAGNGDYR